MNGGIIWFKESVPASVKIALEIIGKEYFYKAGYPEDVISKEWNQISNGFLARENRSDVADRIDHLIPEFREYYNKYSLHKAEYDEVLIHRARNTLLNKETERFKTKIWMPFYRLVESAVSTSTPIDPDRRCAAHETIIEETVTGLPGVYVRVPSENTGWMYLGESADLKRRSGEHSNSNLFLARAYVTGSKSIAVSLQDSIFEALQPYIDFTRLQNGSVSRRGAMKLESGISPVELIDSIVNKNYKHFCRATVGIKEHH